MPPRNYYIYKCNEIKKNGNQLYNIIVIRSEQYTYMYIWICKYYHFNTHYKILHYRTTGLSEKNITQKCFFKEKSFKYSHKKLILIRATHLYTINMSHFKFNQIVSSLLFLTLFVETSHLLKVLNEITVPEFLKTYFRMFPIHTNLPGGLVTTQAHLIFRQGRTKITAACYCSYKFRGTFH